MKNLKDNIWIEGFEDYEEYIDKIFNETKISNSKINKSIYYGKTREIPRELAKECVQYKKHKAQFNGEPYGDGYNYFFKSYAEAETNYSYGNAFDSIQSACDKEYCIIYKK